jgi:hypothetical protein
VQNAAFGSQESLKSSASQVGSAVGQTGAVALQAGAGLAPGAARAGAVATAAATNTATNIGLTALNNSGALDNLSEGQKAGVGFLTSAVIGRGAKRLAPKSIDTGSSFMYHGKNITNAAFSGAGKIKDTVLGPKKFSYAQQAKNNVKSGQLNSRNKFINKQPTAVSPGGVLPRGVNSTAPKTPKIKLLAPAVKL